MKRILFVDDEQQILDGLRDLLRKQRKRWDMVFALGGQAALDALDRGRFDVVVSDMRMPGIGGVSVLQRTKEISPSTARIILSGYADREVVLKALPVAHQFLSKPCNADVLHAVIERACGLQALLVDDDLRNAISSVDRLPSLHHTYWELTQALEHPEVGLTDLVKIVEQDAAMAATVLQLVNSSYFGLAQNQASVRQAVKSLGTPLLKALTLTAHVFVSAADPPIEGFSLAELQRHSVLAARIAERLLEDKQRAEEAFTAALLHDIGKIVLAMSLPGRFAEVLGNSGETGRSTHVVERELLGVTHAEAGAYLLGLWGLPLGTVQAVAYHHDPELLTEPPTETLVAVHVANALSHPPSGSGLGRDKGLNVAFVERSAFGSELPRWRILAEEERRAASRGA